MAAQSDFPGLMADLSDFQTAAGEACESLRNQRNKEILSNLLGELQTARVKLEEGYPKVIELINSTAQRVKAEAEQGLAEAEQLKALVKQRKAELQAAQKKAEEKPPKPVPKVDPTLGPKLRIELLDRYAPKIDFGNAETEDFREAWQDWQ